MTTDIIEINKASPKDIFVHLLAILTLYTSAASFIALIFQYINVLFPDPLEFNSYSLSSSYSIIRWSISSLIVVFPVYLLTSRFLNKEYAATPTKSRFLIRKWLIYLTLFAAALIIIGDLIALINNLLSGELTVRFLLKVLTVFFVAGSVFSYYLWELKKYKSD